MVFVQVRIRLSHFSRTERERERERDGARDGERHELSIEDEGDERRNKRRKRKREGNYGKDGRRGEERAVKGKILSGRE